MDIEDIFGLLFFLAFAAIGVFSNWKKQQEEEKKRQESPKKVRPEELPEATRRMLYGDRSVEVQTAQPRQEEPRHVERPTAPPFVQMSSPRPAAQRTTPPPIQEQVPFPREYQAPPLRPSMTPPPSVPQAQAQTQRSMQEVWQQAQAAKQERAHQMRMQQEHQQQEAQRRILAETLRGRVQVQQQQNVKRPPQRPKHQTSTNRPAMPIAKIPRMLHNLNNVRTGIIMQEVLGPPKGLQRF